MTPEEANRYIGKGWRFGARGPDEYDCWGLLLHVQRTYFGVDIEDVPLGDAARDLFAKNMESGVWQALQEPIHGAGILMRGGDDPHVGIYLDVDGGGALHSMEGHGVIWSPNNKLRVQGFSRSRFYRLSNG